MIIEVIHLIVPILIVVASIFAVLLKDLIAATIALAAMSLLLSLEFYILQAPDVAITMAVVGTGATTILYLVVIKKVRGLK